MINHEKYNYFVFIVVALLLIVFALCVSITKKEQTDNDIKISEKSLNAKDAKLFNLEKIFYGENCTVFKDEFSDVLYIMFYVPKSNDKEIIFVPIATPTGFLTYNEWRNRNE